MRYQSDPYWMRLRYPGRCASCQGSIPAGARGFYYPNGKHIYCERCGDACSRDFESAAFDEELMSR